MLLMSGLMLADRTAGVEDRLKVVEDEAEALRAEIDRLNTALKRSEAKAAEQQAQSGPSLPEGFSEKLTDLTAKAEALADQVEEKTKAG